MDAANFEPITLNGKAFMYQLIEQLVPCILCLQQLFGFLLDRLESRYVLRRSFEIGVILQK